MGSKVVAVAQHVDESCCLPRQQRVRHDHAQLPASSNARWGEEECSPSDAPKRARFHSASFHCETRLGTRKAQTVTLFVLAVLLVFLGVVETVSLLMHLRVLLGFCG